MLLQSHERDGQGRRIIDILPALPKEWPAGSVSGLRARGGYEVDMSWEKGQIKTLKIKSLFGKDFALRLNGEKQTKSYQLEPGASLEPSF